MLAIAHAVLWHRHGCATIRRVYRCNRFEMIPSHLRMIFFYWNLWQNFQSDSKKRISHFHFLSLLSSVASFLAFAIEMTWQRESAARRDEPFCRFPIAEWTSNDDKIWTNEWTNTYHYTCTQWDRYASIRERYATTSVLSLFVRLSAVSATEQITIFNDFTNFLHVRHCFSSF